jgi:predicted negative regulator of RcsB-dependent stress response
MNHPPKKKHKNPLMPEDDIIDERHLVDLEDSAEISFEDRVSIYWMENKGFLVGCITVLLFIVVGYQAMRIYKEHAEAQLQAEYTEASANDALAEFAKANSNKQLGGFAALTTADTAYAAKDYAKALEFYNLATNVLVEPTLAGRAQLGQAFALYENGSTDEGLAKLNAITADSKLAAAARAEAAYHLAIEADVNGNTTEFESYADQINESTMAGPWQQRLSYYERQVH